MQQKINYIENFKITVNNDAISYDSFIEMLYMINLAYNESINQLIHIKPNEDEFSYTALIKAIIHDLDKINLHTFNATKIDSLLSQYNVTKDVLLKWHDDIPQESNELYDILVVDRLTLYLEEYHGDSNQIRDPLNIESFIHVKRLSIVPESLKKSHPVLKKYDREEIKIIQREFGVFINHFYYNKFYEYLMNEARSTIKRNKTDFLWFKIGLLFAQGIPQELYDKYKNEAGHFKKITIELKFKESDRPYFSETLNNTTLSDKNLYADSKKLLFIKNHCTENNINIVNDFLDKIKLD